MKITLLTVAAILVAELNGYGQLTLCNDSAEPLEITIGNLDVMLYPGQQLIPGGPWRNTTGFLINGSGLTHYLPYYGGGYGVPPNVPYTAMLADYEMVTLTATGNGLGMAVPYDTNGTIQAIMPAQVNGIATWIHIGNYVPATYFPGATSASTPTVGGNGTAQSCGMARYSFEEMLVSLRVEDTPIAYKNPRGEDFVFTIKYSQNEYQPWNTNWPHSNLGNNWTFSYLAWVEAEPGDTNGNQRCYPPLGGYEIYERNTNGVYNVQIDSAATLSNTVSGFVRTLADGTTQSFGYAATYSGVTRYYLTSTADTYGNTTTINWRTLEDGSVQLTTIVDPLGRTNYARYETSDPLKLTGITDWRCRNASFSNR